MHIETLRAHRGPNRYVLRPAIHLVLGGDGAGEVTARAVAHRAITLQREVGYAVSYRRTHGREVVFEVRDREVGRLAAEAAVELVRIELGEPGDPRAIRDRFGRDAARHALGPSTASLVTAAEARGIPWKTLGAGSLVRLGNGARQRRIRATVTRNTSVIAAEIASNKSLTNRMLADAGLPVPEQHVVGSVEDALEAARAIGGPVVVKPLDANHGRGVSIRVEGDEAIRAAFAEASAVRARVLVETFVEGQDHRMLVVGGRLVAVARRTPAHVVGDGRRTIHDLIEEVNEDPRRGDGHEKVLTRLVLDEEARRLMCEQGVDERTVLAAGQKIDLRRTANLSKGATAEDVTDRVHPDNRWLAERAARVIGLDVAGVDFLTTEITRSFREVGGAICEVNAAPGFRMHLSPSIGTPRDVGGAVVETLFPRGERATIPTTAITGTNGKTTTARMVAHIHALAGRTVGLATTDGVYVGGELVEAGDMTGPFATEMVMNDPTVEHAVLELARGGLLREGLAIDACDVGAVLNVGNDHLGLGGVDTIDDMVAVKGVIARIARDTAVLDADDPKVRELARRCTRARRIAWVTMHPDNQVVRSHVRHGGLAAILEPAPKGGTLTVYDDDRPRPIAAAAELPATMVGIAEHNVRNALFAAMIAYAGGATIEEVQRGLRDFTVGWETTPGRLNIYRGHPFTVLMDYGHNPEGFRAIGELAQRMEARRRICVVGYPGNRRDEDIVEAARELVPYFDVFVCRGEDDPRGRRPDELPRLFERTFRAAGVPPANVEVVVDEAGGVERGLEVAEPGDLVVIFAAELERTWKQIVGFRPSPSAELSRATWPGS